MQTTRALALVNDIEGSAARSVWTRVCACAETTSFSTFSRQYTFMHVVSLYFHDLDLWKSLNVVL